jgi:hypothetical protein
LKQKLKPFKAERSLRSPLRVALTAVHVRLWLVRVRRVAAPFFQL